MIGIFTAINFSVFSLSEKEKKEDTVTYYFNTVTYYFNAYDEGGEAWAIDPQDMCDGDTGRWARTNHPWQDPTQLAIQHLTANTCDSETSLGTITKVEIRAKVSAPYNPPNINYVTLYPTFNGQDGSNFQITVRNMMWSEWFDITKDTNTPSSWTWDDIVKLDCDVEADVGLSFIDCAIVEIQVTFQTETPPLTYKFA